MQSVFFMIHSFFIFDRHCTCIYSREFTNNTTNKNNQSDISQLLFGTLYSLKQISTKLVDSDEESGLMNSLKSFMLGSYRVHYYESLTGIKFTLVTESSIDNLQGVLWELYSNYYLNTVVKNPLSPVEFSDSGRICNPSFIEQTDSFIKSLQI